MRRIISFVAIVAVACVLLSAHRSSKAESDRSPWPLNAVWSVNDTLSWGVGNNGVIARKIGNSWVLDTLLIARLGSLADSDFTGVFFWDERLGWIVGNRKEDESETRKAMVLRTIDGGESWEARFPLVPQGSRGLKVSFGTRYYGWIIAENGYMLLTNDGGITWSPTYAGDNADSIDQGWSARARR